MKTLRTKRRVSGFSLIEFIAILVVAALLAGLLLAGIVVAKNKAQRVECANNLREIGIAFQWWAEIHHGLYPMQIAVTNSEAIRLLSSSNAYIVWRSLAAPRTTNWLSTNWQPYFEDWVTNDHSLYVPRYLYCPADANRTAQTNFTDLRDANITYFFSLDATETYPQMILDGDDNLAVDGVQVKPGILDLGKNSAVTWTKKRHQGVGNIGLVDCSVQQVTIGSLNTAILIGTNGVHTNAVIPRWVFP